MGGVTSGARAQWDRKWAGEPPLIFCLEEHEERHLRCNPYLENQRGCPQSQPRRATPGIPGVVHAGHHSESASCYAETRGMQQRRHEIQDARHADFALKRVSTDGHADKTKIHLGDHLQKSMFSLLKVWEMQM